MNVTSLLNSGRSRQERSDSMAGSPNHSCSAGTTASTAVHTPTPTPSPEVALTHSKITQSRSPPKLSRTPWEGDDANPFSLPMNLAKSTTITATTRPGLYNESPVDAPRQPSQKLHKLSDSIGSSLSSYTASSGSSLSHSRISSLSTVGESLSWPVNVPDLSELLNTAAPDSMEQAEVAEQEPSSPTPVQLGHEPPPAVDTGQTDVDADKFGIDFGLTIAEQGHQPGLEPLFPLANTQAHIGQIYTGNTKVEHADNGSGDFGHVIDGDGDPEQAHIGSVDQQHDGATAKDEESGGGEDEESGSGEDDEPETGGEEEPENGEGEESGNGEGEDSGNGEEEESGSGHDNGETPSEPSDPVQHFPTEQPDNGHGDGHAVAGTLNTEQQFGYDQAGSESNSGQTNTGLLDNNTPLDTAQHFGFTQPGSGLNNGRTNAGLFDARPLVTAQEFGYDQPGNGHNNGRSEAGAWSAGQQLTRPLSPSDVVMIRRDTGSSYAGTPATESPAEPQQSTESWYSGQTEAAAARTHKRAVSAPDLPALRRPDPLAAYGRDVPATYGRETQPAYGRAAEPAYGQDPGYGREMQPNLGPGVANPAGTYFTPSSIAGHQRLQTIHEPTYSGYQAQVSAQASQAEDSEEEEEDDDNLRKKTALTLAPKSVLDNLDAEPRCMFVRECRTGSQLRKAISHIFGRNKICTRQIPDNIWVHFCRKHYQRCRYRNVQEYAKLQCQLVVKQIQRVQAWSDRNELRNALGVVSGWTLSVRKREQRRMQANKDGNDGALAGRKRPYPGFDGLGLDEGHDRFKDPHAVPDWLLQKCDGIYTTEQTIEIFQRIEQELTEDRLYQIPDIEVLPSITHDPNAEIQYKRYERRKMVEASVLQNQTHRRVQSTGSQWNGPGGGYGQSRSGSTVPNFWAPRSPGPGYQVENLKRQRVDDYGSHQPQAHNWPDVPRSESRTVPNIWRPPPPVGTYLPAPVAQRPGTQSTAQQLESSSTTGYNDPLRSSHQRSQSDASSFRQLPPVGSDSQAPRWPSVNTPNLSTSSYSQRPSPSYYQQDPAPQGSSFTGAQHSQSSAYGAGSNIQHGQGQPYGTGGTGGQQYSGNPYSTSTTRHTPSYEDFPPRQHHPSFNSGPTSYYHQQPATAPPPMTGRQGHTRHQSTPAISQTSQQTYGSGSSFHSTVVPEGYPPDNQTYGHGRQQSFGPGLSREDVDEQRPRYPSSNSPP